MHTAVYRKKRTTEGRPYKQYFYLAVAYHFDLPSYVVDKVSVRWMGAQSEITAGFTHK